MVRTCYFACSVHWLVECFVFFRPCALGSTSMTIVPIGRGRIEEYQGVVADWSSFYRLAAAAVLFSYRYFSLLPTHHFGSERQRFDGQDSAQRQRRTCASATATLWTTQRLPPRRCCGCRRRRRLPLIAPSGRIRRIWWSLSWRRPRRNIRFSHSVEREQRRQWAVLRRERTSALGMGSRETLNWKKKVRKELCGLLEENVSRKEKRSGKTKKKTKKGKKKNKWKKVTTEQSTSSGQAHEGGGRPPAGGTPTQWICAGQLLRLVEGNNGTRWPSQWTHKETQTRRRKYSKNTKKSKT